MISICSVRSLARWLSGVIGASILCSSLPLQAAEPQPAGVSGTLASIAVLDTTGGRVVLSAGERDGIARGAEFRIVRQGQEVARVVIDEVFAATARGKVVSGLPPSQLRVNDRAELIQTPPPRPERVSKFPWTMLVGAGILALVVMSITRAEKKEVPLETQGIADVTIR